MGTLFIISGLSGSGKSTIVDMLSRRLTCSCRLLTCTTRKRRSGEIDGKDYTFMSKEEFHKLVQKGFFVEWAQVYGEFYGTLYISLFRSLKNHKVVLGILDIQGVSTMKKEFPEVISIFIDVDPEVAANRIRISRAIHGELEQRLNPTQIQTEIQAAERFDYRVSNPNSNPEIAVEEIYRIIMDNS